jgi:hypothetical protein
MLVSLTASTLARAKTLQTGALLISIGSIHAERLVIDPTRMGCDIMSSPGLLAVRYQLLFTDRDITAPIIKSELDPRLSPQFPLKDTSSWPASSATQTFLLLDGQVIRQHHEISFSLTIVGP